MLWDTHMHTFFSGDSKASPESMIEASVRKGLSGICFTDHLDLDYPDSPELYAVNPDIYLPEMKKIAEKHADTLTVCTGIELGLQPHLAERLNTIVNTHAFDFVIGSSHVVHGLDPYYFHFFEGKSEHEAYEEYFVSILENIAAYKNFDVYGHIDYVVRYGPNQNQFYSYRKFSDVIDEILKTLIAGGKGIEINTGGFKYGLGHPNPTEDIIKRYRELGGEIITIGADAHAPEHVGYEFNKVPEILTTAGFQYFTVFRERKPQFISLKI